MNTVDNQKALEFIRSIADKLFNQGDRGYIKAIIRCCETVRDPENTKLFKSPGHQIIMSDILQKMISELKTDGL